MLKKLLIAIVVVVLVVIAALAVVTYLAPTDFRVERETTINKPRAEIFSYVKVLKNQNDWGPWFKRDPAMKQEFRGTDGTVGFISSWDSTNEEVGAGEQEIKALVQDQRMDTEVRFKRPFESKADGSLVLEAVDDARSKVKWSIAGSMPRPLNLFLLVMDMDKAMGKDLDDGLASLKAIMEKN